MAIHVVQVTLEETCFSLKSECNQRYDVDDCGRGTVWATTTTTTTTTTTWLILPVVICLSQRLSHACVSTSLSRR